MRRYTTPSHTLVVSGVDLTEAIVRVTYRQANNVVTVEPTEVEYADGRSTIKTTLTEEDTATLNVGNAKVQVNWVIDGVRDATEAIPLKVTENLLEKELIEGDDSGEADGDNVGLGLGMEGGSDGNNDVIEGEEGDADGDGDGEAVAGGEG